MRRCLLALSALFSIPAYASEISIAVAANFSAPLREISQAFGEQILNSYIHAAVAVKESQARGMALTKHSPKSRVAADYMMLAQEIITKTFTGNSDHLKPPAQRNRM